MKKLLIFLEKYKKESVMAPLFKMLEAIFELIVPLVVASIIDNGIKTGNSKFVVSRALILVLLAVIGMTAAITAQYFAAKAATGFATGVRKALYEKIQSFSFTELDNVAGAFVMAMTIDIKASMIFLAVIALLSIVIVSIMKWTVPMYRNVQNTLDGVTLSTRENLAGARVIRAFTEEEQEYNIFSKKNNLLAHFQRQVGRISALMNPVTYVIINLGIVGLIYFGGVRVNNGTLTQGNLVALYNYMSQILVELIKFANLIVTITKGFASGDRVAQILDMDCTLQKNGNAEIIDNHTVSFDNVSLTYSNAGDESLTDISFCADKGQVIGIIGSTGSGKSSLVSLIPHYYDCTKGTVTVMGRDVKSYDKEDLRQHIGFVMQKAILFSGTVRDNIKWGKKDATDDEINEALKVAQIYDSIYEKDGLDTIIEHNGGNLSGGQKQRLSIARAIVSKPEIIVLDDSASALDFATEKALREAILNLDYKPTLFIVSQRCSSILGADKIIVLEDGVCVGQGTNKELLNSCETYREIYSSQFSDDEEAAK